MSLEQFLWTEKYRPTTIENTILPSRLKKVFQSFVDNNAIPNLILTGKSGIGKTTVARAMLDQIGCDYIVINGSLNRNIDTLRNDIMDFASSVSFAGGRKYVILDEADGLNPLSMQPALRNFMEEYSANCGFILTCNNRNKIIEPLHSRCSIVEFNIDEKEKNTLSGQFLKRVQTILDSENVKYDQKTLVSFIIKHFPDWRRILNELQQRAGSNQNKQIESEILINRSGDLIDRLLDVFKAKNFTAARKLIAENSDVDYNLLFTELYQVADERVDKQSIAQWVVHIAEYQYKAAFVADQEINFAACIAQLMADCQLNGK